MTFISDLSARAIAFITAIQTALVNVEVEDPDFADKNNIFYFAQQNNPGKELTSKFLGGNLKIRFSERAIELVGLTSRLVNNNQINKYRVNKNQFAKGIDDNEAVVDYAIYISANLVGWIHYNWQKGISKIMESHGCFPSPNNWRMTIEKILYENPVERLRLAIALQYLPIQIILALGGGDLDADEQRTLQMWNPNVVDYFKVWEKIEDQKEGLWIPNNEARVVILAILKKEENPLSNTTKEEWYLLTEQNGKVWSDQLKKMAETQKEKLEKEPLKAKTEKEKKELETIKKRKLKELETPIETFVFEAIKLLLDHSKVINQLIAKEVPLSFELIFSEELEEIALNRVKRKKEEIITDPHAQSGKDDPKTHNNFRNTANKAWDRPDPFEKAKQMGIRALAISGGGIRSATFNLGILQGFAENKLIGKFDYLSTVSGGGYIGSWLTTWIKRNHSVVKVSNRLCPRTSPDPAGAELKPIKWLRMYSNYFAPNSSLMSVDSWTIGITWLRNTLLNQAVLFLLFLAVLFAGNSLYYWWSEYLVHDLNPTRLEVILWSSVFLLPVALLSGLGMSVYDKKDSGRGKMVLNKWIRTLWILPYFKTWKYRITISQGIIGYTIISAFIISAWLSSCFYDSLLIKMIVGEKLNTFLPSAILAFGCLFLVGYLGNYTKYIMDFKKSKSSARFILFIVTLFSALFGWITLAYVSVFLEQMTDFSFGPDSSYIIDKRNLQFIFGIPLIIEVFVFSIIVRMALLGKYFPDERREWWGRIGADIHRICFLWVLVFASALLGWKFMQFAYVTYGNTIIAATGGWVALVGICVKAAFSSKTADKGEEKGKYATFLGILSMVGPYLFILGLLILLPALTKPLLRFLEITFIKLGIPAPAILYRHLWVTLFCAIVALLLGKQLGVNEFSMYNFYKNRLVRAFLGGTRRSTNRQKSANPYTGFDMEDDELLYKFCHAEGYHGPYHILNCALNATQGQELDRQDRKAESFIFSPLFCGFDFSMARDPDDKDKSYDYAYRKTQEYAFTGAGPYIGTAMAISGAAVNPNQGYHSSPPIAFLLTVFNAQMGRWLGNPRKSSWKKSDPLLGLSYIISNLINKSTTRDEFVSLSDGGHFDNMGLYEMVRRKCPYIILCDAEQDSNFTCEGLANAIRRCRIDFGAEITIDISKITDRTEDRYSKTHYALGKITYVGDNHQGVLLYIKSSITGNEPVDVFEYALKNKTFPHQTTADQFFNEEQFETYRKLGLHIAGQVLSDKNVIEEFKLEHKKQSFADALKEVVHPFETFHNSIKGFFMERNKKDNY